MVRLRIAVGKGAAATLALCCALWSAVVRPPSASATTLAAATLVAANSAQMVADPGVTLAARPDGRLAGNGFESTIAGEAIGTRFGLGANSRQAAPGQHLFASAISGTLPGQTLPTGQTLTATVVVDGARLPLAGEPTTATATSWPPCPPRPGMWEQPRPQHQRRDRSDLRQHPAPLPRS